MHGPYIHHLSVACTPIFGQTCGGLLDIIVFKWLFELEQCGHLQPRPLNNAPWHNASGSLWVDQSPECLEGMIMPLSVLLLALLKSADMCIALHCDIEEIII